jgi:hypothetical protein
MDEMKRETHQNAGLVRKLYKTFLFGVGGSATLEATYVKAYANDDPLIGIVSGDVMDTPPTVFVRRNGADVPVTLEPALEYVRFGTEMDMPALWTDVRMHGKASTLAARIVGLSPTVPSTSVEIGTEARRQLGYAAFIWSQPEIDRAIERTLRRLGDVRVKDASGNVINDAPINVVLMAGFAGGVGAGSMLPAISLVKAVMHRIGLPVHRSLFTIFGVGASAFPLTDLRLSNAFETLHDLELAQKKGVTLCSD